MGEVGDIIGNVADFHNLLNETGNLCKSNSARHELYKKTIGTVVSRTSIVEDQLCYVHEFIDDVMDHIMRPRHYSRISKSVYDAPNCAEKLQIAHRQTISKSFAKETKLYTFESLRTLNREMAKVPDVGCFEKFLKKVRKYAVPVEEYDDISDSVELKKRIDTALHLCENCINQIALEVDKFYNGLSDTSSQLRITDTGNNIGLFAFSAAAGSADCDLQRLAFDVNYMLTDLIEVINKDMYTFSKRFCDNANFELLENVE